MKQYGIMVRLSDVNSADESFAKAKENGFSCCQLVFKPEKYTLDDAKIIKAAAEKHGVEIVSLFAGFQDSYTKWDIYGDYKTAGINSKKYGKSRIRYIKSAADFVKMLGVNDILIHAGFVANNPFSKEYKYMVKCLKNFAVYCKNIQVNVLLETGGESPVSLLRLIEDVGTENIYVNLDTANLIMYGYGNPVDAVVTLNKHIRSMHAKDGMPPISSKKLGEEVTIGEGHVDFKKVFAELDKVGFDGPVIIEREISGDDMLAEIVKAKSYLDSQMQ